MASQLIYPLVSCRRLSHLLKASPDLALIYLSDDSEAGIPGSIQVPISALKDVDLLLEYLRGLSEESALLVCYEGEGLRWASSAWWLLVSKGWRLVMVLEGGLKAWRGCGDMGGVVRSPVSSPTVRSRRESKSLKVRKVKETQEVTTDKSATHIQLFIDPSLLLKHGLDLAEPKFLKWVLAQAGLRLEDECETVVFGPEAHLLLLVLCSLGKRSIRQGVELTEGLNLYTDDDASTQPQRKVSVKSDIDSGENLDQQEVVVDHMSESLQAKYTNTLSYIGPSHPVVRKDIKAAKVCTWCVVF